MFKAGIAELKAKEPWRFPFALYLDNWCVFPLCRTGRSIPRHVTSRLNCNVCGSQVRAHQSRVQEVLPAGGNHSARFPRAYDDVGVSFGQLRLRTVSETVQRRDR